MTRRPFDPDELPGVEGLEEVTAELDRYAGATSDAPADDVATRIMAAVAGEPLPRRGAAARVSAFFAGLGPMRRPAQAVALVAVLALGLGGALLAGGLIGQLRELQVGTSPSPAPTNSPSPSPSPSPTLAPSPSPSPTVSPSPTPSTSPTEAATPRPTATDDDDDDETPRPTASDDDDGSDDNSGPGGGGDD